MKHIGSRRPMVIAQAGMKRDLTAIFRAGIEQMKTVLVRAASNNGAIPASQQVAVRAQIKQLTSNIFTGTNDQPFSADGITPLAPYPKLMNQWLAWSVYQAVRQHEAWLRQHVPEDVFRQLRMARRRTIVSEQQRIFEPNPLAQIDPSRRWVPPNKWTDERGYRLSDRIWRSDLETRRKIDELLAKGLAEGQGALELSKALEAYLLPGREGIRTLKPYGRRFQPGGASADAMRLSRTEIAQAFNSAALIAGQMNPYVTGMDWARSSNGDASCPICPEHCTIDISGMRVRDPYDINAADIPPGHPHCMCNAQSVVTDTPADVTAQLRDDLQTSAADLDINPSDAWAFTSMLLDPILMQMLAQLGLKPMQEILFF